MMTHFFKVSVFVFLASMLNACNFQEAGKTANNFHSGKRPAKFEPADGKVILFAGQELEAIGGTENYRDGYFDHYPAPGGFVQYTAPPRDRGAGTSFSGC